MKQYEIRADYDKETIVVYQAYRKEIATKAIGKKQFCEPFSFNRMTWIKPSFLWLMERSGYGEKSGQEYILGIRIKRSAWEYALAQGVLTHPKEGVYKTGYEWSEQMDNSQIHIQWDPERSIKGAKLNHRSIQVGISRHLIKEYNEEWIKDIIDYTPLASKIYDLRLKGEYDKAKRLLPKEKMYPVSEEIMRKLGMD